MAKIKSHKEKFGSKKGITSSIVNGLLYKFVYNLKFIYSSIAKEIKK